MKEREATMSLRNIPSLGSLSPQRSCAAAVACLFILWSPGPAHAQDGWYLGMEMGLAVAPQASLSASDNDWSTKCDLLNNPNQVEVDGGCDTVPPRAMWGNEIDGGSGMLAALTFGYRAGRFRFEGEYAHRTATYGDASPVRIGDEITRAKADQELEAVDSRIDGLLGHSFFANVTFDIAPNAGYTPWVGLGAGMSSVSVDYFNRWKRNDNPDLISTFEDPAMKARIAGTTTIAGGRRSDTTISYQALAGLDRRLSERVTLGIKFRWTILGEFEDSAEYIQLRSHESSVGRGERIVYDLVLNDLSAAVVTLNLRYAF